uniref:Putative glycine-rich cell wall structural protein 1 n=1 Tax=Rhipicephalus microplus TaxID=6941 RepID=A0A6G5A2Z9_RHIMP
MKVFVAITLLSFVAFAYAGTKVDLQLGPSSSGSFGVRATGGPSAGVGGLAGGSFGSGGALGGLPGGAVGVLPSGATSVAVRPGSVGRGAGLSGVRPGVAGFVLPGGAFPGAWFPGAYVPAYGPAYYGFGGLGDYYGLGLAGVPLLADMDTVLTEECSEIAGYWGGFAPVFSGGFAAGALPGAAGAGASSVRGSSSSGSASVKVLGCQ